MQRAAATGLAVMASELEWVFSDGSVQQFNSAALKEQILLELATAPKSVSNATVTFCMPTGSL